MIYSILTVSGMYIICKHNKDDSMLDWYVPHQKQFGVTAPQVSFPLHLISAAHATWQDNVQKQLKTINCQLKANYSP
jgi:hypothetical protein